MNIQPKKVYLSTSATKRAYTVVAKQGLTELAMNLDLELRPITVEGMSKKQPVVVMALRFLAVNPTGTTLAIFKNLKFRESRNVVSDGMQYPCSALEMKTIMVSPPMPEYLMAQYLKNENAYERTAVWVKKLREQAEVVVDFTADDLEFMLDNIFGKAPTEPYAHFTLPEIV